MKTTSLAAFAVLAAALVPSVPQLLAAPQAFSGTISDTMCGKKHMMPGKSDADCVKECVQAGSSYALVVGDKVYTLAGKSASIAPYAGKQVQVQGDLKGSTITVASIKSK